MEPLSRRAALGLGAVGVASATLGGVGLARSGWPHFGDVGGAGGVAGEALVEPPVVRATDGVLDVDLVAAVTSARVAGRRAVVLAYNGSVPGPTMALRPGDALRVRLVNELDEPTNLHVHGLHVPPTGRGDDPLVRVPRGGTHRYELRIPADHPTGLFWYHPHHHGTVADQVFGGLYGAILLSDDTQVGERVLVVSDLTLTPAGRVAAPTPMARLQGREGDSVLLDGQLRPVLTAPAGSRERWRVLNACSSRYLDLELEGATWTVLGIDGGRDPSPVRAGVVRLAPGNRADLLVTVPAGTSRLVTAPVDRGVMMPGPSEPVVLATVRGLERQDAPRAVDLAPPPPVRDLRLEPTTARRRVRLGEPGMGMGADMGGGMGGDMSGAMVTIEGRRFDPARTDVTVAVGTVEEWTFENASSMRHPMHLHVWPMQLVAVDGAKVGPALWRDVVDVSPGGSTTVRVAFDDHAGTTVVHCHVLDHEDLGMMAVVRAR